jgi:hypothetical protein
MRPIVGVPAARCAAGLARAPRTGFRLSYLATFAAAGVLLYASGARAAAEGPTVTANGVTIAAFERGGGFTETVTAPTPGGMGGLASQSSSSDVVPQIPVTAGAGIVVRGVDPTAAVTAEISASAAPWPVTVRAVRPGAWALRLPNAVTLPGTLQLRVSLTGPLPPPTAGTRTVFSDYEVALVPPLSELGATVRNRSLRLSFTAHAAMSVTASVARPPPMHRGRSLAGVLRLRRAGTARLVIRLSDAALLRWRRRQPVCVQLAATLPSGEPARTTVILVRGRHLLEGPGGCLGTLSNAAHGPSVARRSEI